MTKSNGKFKILGFKIAHHLIIFDMNQPVFVKEELNPLNKEVDKLLQRLEAVSSSEEKLKSSIVFMQEALSQEGMPNFKGFWEVRKICLTLFKDSMNASVRAELWSQYIELTREGRRLKHLLDEETAFAVEQIDLAIGALEKEVQVFQQDPEKALERATSVEFLQDVKTLEARSAYYGQLQKELNVLNMFASRINQLRKELIKTEMRIRQKNKFFQRLSSLGDLVFSPRKAKIREVSEAFIQDVHVFVESFEKNSDEKQRHSVFLLREEIKTLQRVAKCLTLNTHAFSTTRAELGKCWDQLKLVEKERKKEYAEQKVQSASNFQKVQSRIHAFSSALEQGDLSNGDELKEISAWMRELELTRDDVKTLKCALDEAWRLLEAKEEEEKRRSYEQEIEFEKIRKEKVEAFKGNIDDLKEKVQQGNFEELFRKLEEKRRALSSLSITKSERQLLEAALKDIRDLIAEKQEENLLTLSADDHEVLQNLEHILEERKQRRKEVKAQIEEYRKITGGSGLDFEKAMRFGELMSVAKDRLAKINEGIAQIEKKIQGYKFTSRKQ